MDFPYLLFRDQIGSAGGRGARPARCPLDPASTDVPNALRDMFAGRLRPGEYLRSLRGVNTEAVFSISDPLPGLLEIALLPYLAVKRGLLRVPSRTGARAKGGTVVRSLPSFRLL